jgi:hypothetical protein
MLLFTSCSSRTRQSEQRRRPSCGRRNRLQAGEIEQRARWEWGLAAAQQAAAHRALTVYIKHAASDHSQSEGASAAHTDDLGLGGLHKCNEQAREQSERGTDGARAAPGAHSRQVRQTAADKITGIRERRMRGAVLRRGLANEASSCLATHLKELPIHVL